MLTAGVLLQERYKIIRPIARGGMGMVYQAIDQRLDHSVAIKQITRSDSMLQTAFEQEARLLAALRHPALPKVTDHFVEPTGHFLVMEFIPGDDLATLALRQREPLALDDVLRWADQLLELLTYLHGQTPPVIHRDIKPHNLKLTAQGAVILLDFGLATGAPGPESSEKSIAGYTLHYASPEQLRGEESGPASDLYSLAATLYDLLAMTKPPDALQRLAAITTGQADPLQPLQTRNLAVPLAVAEVIHQALSLSPQARFADAAAMRLAFRTAQGEATQIVSPTVHPPTSALTSGQLSGQLSGPTHNLPPQFTSFVARETEVTAVQQLLQDDSVRLVTLTGPGGIGKTRLAIVIATRCLAEFPNGVFFVSLAPIIDSALVLPTIAQTLGLREAANTTMRQTLHSYLHDRRLLLLLDNFEQVVTAAPEITDLLSTAPRLKILVTSRETLHVRGEQEFPVPTLALPDPRHPPAPEVLGQVAAIRLFVQRSQAVKPDFALDGNNAAIISEICRRLDGLPLALELAAASVKILPVQAILARLAERLDLPTKGPRDLPDRQRTLRASIAWSYDLLTDKEKSIFQRLCIFSSSFALDAAENVCEKTGIDKAIVFDTIVSLISKSLCKSLESGENETRFTMLETIREFGLRRLDEAGETLAVRAAHAAYYDQLVQEAERNIWGAGVAKSVKRLDEEIENVRATLTYYLAHPQEAQASLRVAGSLWRFWEMRGYIQEGRTWIERALERREEVPPSSRWLPLHGAGNLAVDQGDYAIAHAHYEESRHLLQGMLASLDDPNELLRTRYALANTLTNIGHIFMLQSQYREAVAWSEEALTLLRTLLSQPGGARSNFKIGVGIALTNLALIKVYQSQYTQAETYGNESLALYRELGDARGIGWNLHTLGTIARNRGDYEQAAKLYGEAKSLFETISNQPDMILLLFDLGELARLQGNDDEAEAKYQAGLTLAHQLGNKQAVATLLDRLSLLACRQGNYAEALTLSNQSISLQRELSNLLGLSDALQSRGEIARARLDFAAATADLTESLTIKARLGEQRGVVSLLKLFADLAMAEGRRAERAARLVAAAEMLRKRIGVNVPPCEQRDDATRLNAIQRALGQDLFASIWLVGQTMDAEQAVAYALTKK